MINRFFAFILIVTFACSCTQQKDKAINVNYNEVLGLKTLNPKQSIIIIDSVLNVEGNEFKRGLLYHQKSINYFRLLNYKQTLKYSNLALEIFEQYNDEEQLAKTYIYLGNTNIALSKKELGLEQLLIALNYSENVKKQDINAAIYASLSRAYFLYKDYNKSTDYIFKATEIYKQLKDTIQISASYNNLAIIYRHINNYRKALEYSKKSLEINRLFEDSTSIAMSYNNIGLVYTNLNATDTAEVYYNKAITLNRNVNPLNTSPLVNLANLYFENNSIKAEPLYLQVLQTNKLLPVEKKKEVYDKLLRISLKKKNFNNALLYQEKRDSISKIQFENELKEKYDLVENQFKLAAREKDLSQEKEINKRNKIVFASIIGILVLASLFLFQTIKNKSLKSENEKIDLEQNVLRSQMNPHFIFNAISAIQNSLLDNEPLKSATYLAKFAKLIRQNFDFVEKKSITLKDEFDMLENYVSTQQLRFKDKFDFKLDIDKNINIEETKIPPLLLQPFIENSIEHGFKNKKDKGLIEVSITKTKNSINYTIKDNGKGLCKEDSDGKKHAIDVFKRRLRLLGDAAEKTFLIISNQKGTTVKFTLRQ